MVRKATAAAQAWQYVVAGVGGRDWVGHYKPLKPNEWLIPEYSGHSFLSPPNRPAAGTWAQEACRMQDATDTVRGLVVELSSLK